MRAFQAENGEAWNLRLRIPMFSCRAWLAQLGAASLPSATAAIPNDVRCKHVAFDFGVTVHHERQ